jgi:putative membrane protein
MITRYQIQELGLVQTAFFTALGIIIAAHTSSFILYDSPASLLVAVLVLTAVNILLKPFIVFFAFPFILVTFGLGMWIVNALLFKWVGSGMVEGFVVATWGAALWGSFIISLSKSIGTSVFGGGLRAMSSPRPFEYKHNDHRKADVDKNHIDI